MKDHECPECEGFGIYECESCGSQNDCDDCLGTGLDPEKYDVMAWKKALREFLQTNGMAHAWYVEGRELGVITLYGDRLAFEDFRRKERGS